MVENFRVMLHNKHVLNSLSDNLTEFLSRDLPKVDTWCNSLDGLFFCRVPREFVDPSLQLLNCVQGLFVRFFHLLEQDYSISSCLLLESRHLLARESFHFRKESVPLALLLSFFLRTRYKNGRDVLFYATCPDDLDNFKQ